MQGAAVVESAVVGTVIGFVVAAGRRVVDIAAAVEFGAEQKQAWQNTGWLMCIAPISRCLLRLPTGRFY